MGVMAKPKIIEQKIIEPKIIEPKIIEPKIIEPKIIEYMGTRICVGAVDQTLFGCQSFRPIPIERRLSCMAWLPVQTDEKYACFKTDKPYKFFIETEAEKHKSALLQNNGSWPVWQLLSEKQMEESVWNKMQASMAAPVQDSTRKITQKMAAAPLTLLPEAGAKRGSTAFITQRLSVVPTWLHKDKQESKMMPPLMPLQPVGEAGEVPELVAQPQRSFNWLNLFSKSPLTTAGAPKKMRAAQSRKMKVF